MQEKKLQKSRNAASFHIALIPFKKIYKVFDATKKESFDLKSLRCKYLKKGVFFIVFWMKITEKRTK